MRLTEPIEIWILDVMADGGAYNPVRVLYEIEQEHDYSDDWGREYVGQRMARLRDLELLERVCPDNSGLYRISELGETALEVHRETGETEFSFAELMGRIGGER
jgi:hypothetical protein